MLQAQFKHCPHPPDSATPSPHAQARIRPPLSPVHWNDTATHPPALWACTHTHTVMNTNTAASTCCTEGGLRSTETMWSDPAHPHPHAHPAHTVCLRRDSCARLLSLVIFVRPSACLQITLSSSSHLYWHSTHFVFCCLFFFFFSILCTFHFGRLARR